ncbi:hypothetical protein GCM10023338_07840 [Wohlfahrtiimonas larvae]|uniref:Uncharacterized protein n=1 Tax=Wohlfahrtiimonas larvae TaxID=1157986 RepID=A0ABP9MLA5_9GAMM
MLNYKNTKVESTITTSTLMHLPIPPSHPPSKYAKNANSANQPKSSKNISRAHFHNFLLIIFNLLILQPQI